MVGRTIKIWCFDSVYHVSVKNIDAHSISGPFITKYGTLADSGTFPFVQTTKIEFLTDRQIKNRGLIFET